MTMITLGFLNLLTLLFVAAKLFGHFDHSWWAAFAPTIFGTAALALVLTLAVVSKVLAARRLRRRVGRF